jgi:hypothetical protein
MATLTSAEHTTGRGTSGFRTRFTIRLTVPAVDPIQPVLDILTGASPVRPKAREVEFHGIEFLRPTPIDQSLCVLMASGLRPAMLHELLAFTRSHDPNTVPVGALLSIHPVRNDSDDLQFPCFNCFLEPPKERRWKFDLIPSETIDFWGGCAFPLAVLSVGS